MEPEEGERISQTGKDGTIFVLDLSHIDGQHAAEALECEHEEVEIILLQRTNNLQYLLVLQPKDGQTVPVLVEPTDCRRLPKRSLLAPRIPARHSASWSHRRQNTSRRYLLA